MVVTLLRSAAMFSRKQPHLRKVLRARCPTPRVVEPVTASNSSLRGLQMCSCAGKNGRMHPKNFVLSTSGKKRSRSWYRDQGESANPCNRGKWQWSLLPFRVPPYRMVARVSISTSRSDALFRQRRDRGSQAVRPRRHGKGKPRTHSPNLEFAVEATGCSVCPARTPGVPATSKVKVMFGVRLFFTRGGVSATS